MFTREFLLCMRGRALRKGLWYKALDHVERCILRLTSRIVNRVESEVLGVVLVGIVKKLKDAMESKFVKKMQGSSLVRAKEVADQAVEWGYRAAREWASDVGFIRYLTLVDINTSSREYI